MCGSRQRFRHEIGQVVHRGDVVEPNVLPCHFLSDDVIINMDVLAAPMQHRIVRQGNRTLIVDGKHERLRPMLTTLLRIPVNTERTFPVIVAAQRA